MYVMNQDTKNQIYWVTIDIMGQSATEVQANNRCSAQAAVWLLWHHNYCSFCMLCTLCTLFKLCTWPKLCKKFSFLSFLFFFCLLFFFCSFIPSVFFLFLSVFSSFFCFFLLFSLVLLFFFYAVFFLFFLMVSNATKRQESPKKFGGHTKIKNGHKTG